MVVFWGVVLGLTEGRDTVVFGIELSYGCEAAGFGTRLLQLRPRGGKLRAGVDRLFALRESTWSGQFDSGAMGGPKRVGGGAFFTTGSVNLS